MSRYRWEWRVRSGTSLKEAKRYLAEIADAYRTDMGDSPVRKRILQEAVRVMMNYIHQLERSK
jgi:hypothetical protein